MKLSRNSLRVSLPHAALAPLAIVSIALAQIAFALLIVPPAAAMDGMDMSNMNGSRAAAASDSAEVAGSSSTAKLALSVNDADSVWLVQATFTGLDSAGKLGPLPNQTVSFYVKRLFGRMPMRDDDNTAVTDDSGHAVIQMPKNIPGGTTGMVTIVARVEGDDQTGLVATRDSGRWGTIVPLVANPFPRELWEPGAPIAMVITFSILFGGVWVTYGWVAAQVVTIKKESHNA